MRKRFLATITAALAVCTIGSGIASSQSQSDAIEDFKDANPSTQFYFEGGEFKAIYGQSFSQGDTPENSVLNFLDRYAGIFGPGLGDLAAIPTDDGGDIIRSVKYDNVTGTYEFSLISYQQTVRGVPVFRSKIGFLMRNEPGYPMVMSGFSLRDMSGAAPARGDAEVNDRMKQNVQRSMGVLDISVGDDSKLVIWAGVDAQNEKPRLAVQFTATHGTPADGPNYQRRLYVADAQNGKILFTENQIFEFADITGNVSGMATDGWQSGNCDPQSIMTLPYGEVRVQGGNTTNADVNGDFVIPHGGNGQVTVESFLRGPWFEIRDTRSGGSTPSITMNVTPPGPANFVHNQANNSEFVRAGVDGYLHANAIRDWVLGHAPNFPIIGTQQGFDVNVNINSNCNAFYDGRSINFYTSGGGCSNTANSTVVYHEYGHHLISVTGNGQGQMGEGTGDTVAVLISDQPLLAPGFQSCNSPLRNAINNLQYPCSGTHNCAGVLSGSIWDTRNELIITEPTDYQDILSSLFVNMLIVRGGTGGQNGQQITPFITLVMLELDDNDGNINNGTPHYQEIAAGFGAHNLDAPPIDFTVLTDFQVIVGTYLDGDLGDLERSDNQRLRVRSGFGQQISELHKMEIVFNANTIINSPSTIDLVVESRNNQPGGQGFVSLRNWNTNQFEKVANYPVNGSDTTRNINGIPATDYVNANGDMDLHFKYTIFAPFLAFNFNSTFDVLTVTVNN